MAHNREEGHCCGSVLTLIKDPLVAHEIGKSRLDEAVDIKADSVLALCPCCEFQLRVSKDKKDIPVEIHDLAAFACRALGKEFKDPNPEVSRQWAVFEGMIALMTPEGFADLMDTMWPEMLDAMPLGMGDMMRFMGKLGFVGGAMFALMKPVFPHPLSQTSARNDAQGHADHAGQSGRQDSHARLHGRTDAGYDAQGDGQPDAQDAARCGSSGRSQDDHLSPPKISVRGQAFESFEIRLENIYCFSSILYGAYTKMASLLA